VSIPVETQIIARARDMIADPNCWCQGSGGRDANDKPVNYGDLSRAKKVCAYGALARAASEIIADPQEADGVACSIARRMVHSDDEFGGHTILFEFNDAHSHREVLALFDEALQEARA